MKNKLFIGIITFLLHNIIFAQEFTDSVRSFITVDSTLVAITNITLIDGTGEDFKQNQSLLIREGIITEVGDANTIQLPDNTLIIDGTGKTVIPGFIMLHEHLFYPKPFENWFSVGQMPFTFPRLYLAGGVTTMRTAGSIQPETDLNIKKWINEGKMTGPKMDVTGPFIEREGYEIPELGFIKGTEDVEKMVNYWADRGVTSFKVYNNITKEDLRICVEEAHKRGLKVTGHLCSITHREASDIGIDNLEHGFMVASDFIKNKEENRCDPFQARNALDLAPEDGQEIESLIDHLIKNNTAITTTPVVFEPYTGHEIVPGGGLEALAPQFQDRVKATYNRSLNRDQKSTARFTKNLKWLKRFNDKGGLLVAGTDPTGAGRTVAGYANQRTVEILVESGFTIEEAIHICTQNGAIYLDKQEETGTIKKGKKADLVLIQGNLMENIKNIRNMEIVFKDGIGYDSKKLFKSVIGKVGLN